MSVDRLSDAIRRLPRRQVDVSDIRKLQEAAGSKINDDEAALLQKLAREKDRFTADGRAMLEELLGTTGSNAGPGKAKATSFELKGRHEVDIGEPSALAFISPEHGFVVAADDGSALWQVGIPRGKKADATELEPSGGKLKGLEGGAYDADAKTLLLVSEDTREVLQVKVDRGGDELSLGKAERLCKLPALNDEGNKGWEGIAVLPARLSPDGKPHLLAVHEGSPRRIGVLDRKSGEVEALLELPESHKDALEDLSDITVDPRTGHLFILSDRAETILEASLKLNMRGGAAGRARTSWELEGLGTTELPRISGSGRLQPEGLAFDHRGDLWVTSEGGKGLLHLERKD
ncbi:MAG: SdiA-regulated domain-containing protein [Myxococcota bacterium]